MFGEIAHAINYNFANSIPFTPVLGDGTHNFVLSAANGTYCKWGNVIFFNTNSQWTSKNSATGLLKLQVPFIIGNTANVVGFVGYSSGIVITGAYLIAFGSSGNNYFTFQGISVGGAATDVNASVCQNTGIVQLGGFYWIN